MFKIIGIMAFVSSLFITQAAFADSWMCGDRIEKTVTSLKLDETQKEKIKPILEQLKSTLRENGNQMKDLGMQMDQQVNSANMDESTMNDLVDKKTTLLGNMMKAKLRAKQQILMVLNDQQKTEFQNKMRELDKKWTDMFKNCHENDA